MLGSQTFVLGTKIFRELILHSLLEMWPEGKASKMAVKLERELFIPCSE